MVSAQLLTLRAGHTVVAPTFVSVGLGYPVPNGLGGGLELLGQFLRIPAVAHQLDHLPAKLRRIAVICLVSALAFHEITTQIPHQVDIAVPRGTKQPRLDFPPTRIFGFSEPVFGAGVATHRVDGVPVRVYAAAKTVADCFRFRNRIGIDVAVEGLRFFYEHKKAPIRELLDYARLCRVERIMMPYIEALQ